jgi:O-antigen ligase
MGAAQACFALAVLLIIAAVVLGGASRENPMRLAAVELCALPLVAVAIRRIALEGGQRTGTFPTVILTLIVAVPLLQMIPLPSNLWTDLTGQAPRTEALRLVHLPIPWLAVSLSSDDTGRAVLALIPPGAMFLAAAYLAPDRARRLAWLWIASAAAGLALGVVQVAAPAGGLAYPYRTTNLGSLVGLFANRNHEAGFLLALLPFAAALALPDGPPGSHRRSRRAAGLVGWVAWPFILVAIVALGVIRSRAGVILAGPAALAATALMWRGRRRKLGGWPMAALATAIGLAAAAVAGFGLGPILGRFERQASAEFRFEAWPLVVGAVQSFLPLGSGVGSFDPVFEAVEPLAIVGPTYFNHAHNDYMELWLETGWLGAAIFVAFLLWFLPATARAWRSGLPLAQAASAAIVLLMAQSAVDYPLRTESLAVLFAFCCGLLAGMRRPRQ